MTEANNLETAWFVALVIYYLTHIPASWEGICVYAELMHVVKVLCNGVIPMNFSLADL